MAILTPSGLETSSYGASGWNASNTANVEKINANLGHALNDGSKTADIQIKGSGNTSGSSAFAVKNSDGDQALEVKNDRTAKFEKSLEVAEFVKAANVQLAEVELAGTDPAASDFSAWANKTLGIGKGTGGKIFLVWKNAAGCFKQEMTAV